MTTRPGGPIRQPRAGEFISDFLVNKRTLARRLRPIRPRGKRHHSPILIGAIDQVHVIGRRSSQGYANRKQDCYPATLALPARCARSGIVPILDEQAANRVMTMERQRAAFLAVSLFFATGIASSYAANDVIYPNVIKPGFYQSADIGLSNIDQQRLTAYRNQLEVQQRAQQLRVYQGGSRPQAPISLSRPLANPAIASRNLFETQSELNRVNSLLRSAHTAQILAPMNPSGASRTPAFGFMSFNPGMPP